MKKDILKKLKKYGSAAVGTVLASSASASIVYTDIDPDVSQDSLLSSSDPVFQIDFDGDANFDLTIFNYAWTYLSTTNGTFGTSGTYKRYMNFRSVYAYVGSTGGVLASSGGSPSALSAGDNISNLDNFSSGWNRMIRQFNYSTSFNAPSASNTSSASGSSSTSSVIGNFPNGATKFIGVKFDISGSTHYGWVRVTPYANSVNSSVTILDYAYEKCPGQPIQAGQVSGGAYEIAMYDFNGCDSTFAFGTKYTSSTTLMDTILGGSAAGCDSITISNIIVQSPVTTTEDRVACGTATINGNTYTTSQAVTDLFTGGSALGCDSTHITNLVIDTYSQANYNFAGCDSIDVFGTMYYSSQVVNDTVLNGSVANCDTITTLNITLNNTVKTSEDLIVCGTVSINGNFYISSDTIVDVFPGGSLSGCDSIHTTNLTIGNKVVVDQVLEVCDETTINGVTYTADAVVRDTILGTVGCDTINVINLSVLSSTTSSVDTILAEGESMTIDGNVVTTSGTYTEITPNPDGCDHTTTYNVTAFDGINNSQADNLRIYPNPTKDKVIVNAENVNSNIKTITVIDIQGKELLHFTNLNSNMNDIDLSGVENGVYFLKVILANGEQQVSRIVKMK